MKRMVKCFIILLVALSPSFLVYKVSPQVANAEICPIGVASMKSGTSFVCEDSEEDTMQGKNQTEIDNWRKYLRGFSIGLAGLSLGLAVLMTAYAGFLYTVSEGDAEKIKKAKLHLIMAGGGVMISMMTFLIDAILTNVIT